MPSITEKPIESVTEAQIASRIYSVQYFGDPSNPTVTICSITLDNNYSVRGESACVDVRKFNAALGQKLAYAQAFSKLWPLFGFLLAEDIHRREQDEEDAQ